MNKGFYQTKASVEEYIKLAEDVNGKELIDKLLLVLPLGTELLEIGSGPGSDYSILTKSYKVKGSDNSEEFLKHLKAKYTKGEFLKLEATTLDTKFKFEGLYSNKVLHHLRNDELKSSIKKQNELLSSDGIICHSFWKGEGSEVFKDLYVNYHSEESLRELVEEYFDIISIETYKEFEDGDSLLLLARKAKATG